MLQPRLRVGRVRLIPVLALLFLAPSFARDPSNLKLSWKDNLLRIQDARIPAGSIEVWYLEAFCRKGSTQRPWNQTVVPHTTRIVAESADGDWLELESQIEGGVIADHRIESGTDEIRFGIDFHNPTGAEVDIEWAQPCVRVGSFMGRGQEDYWVRCFVFTESGSTFLDRVERAKEALYPGGQVYVPEGIDLDDVNPRPLSPVVPVHPIIGCVSHDNRWILASAWSSTQELFQGVIVCIHSDFRIGGLAPGEKKKVTGKIYLVPNDPKRLLARYLADTQDFLSPSH